MATYGISPLVSQLNKKLSTAQRMSSLFSEAPIVAGKILRRGTEIVLNELQYLQQKSKINVLVNAGAVKVRVISEDGKVSVQPSADKSSKLKVPDVSGSVAPPPDGVAAPGVVESSAQLAAEVTKDVAGAVVPEVSAVVNPVVDAAAHAVSEQSKKSRKNK